MIADGAAIQFISRTMSPGPRRPRAPLATAHQDLVEGHGGVVQHGGQQLLLGQGTDAAHLVAGQLSASAGFIISTFLSPVALASCLRLHMPEEGTMATTACLS